MKRRRSLLVLAVLVFWGIWQHAWLLRRYADFFTVNNPSPGADALLVLSGNPLTRIPHAIELWQQGIAPKILLTDERPRNRRFAHLEPSNEDYAEAMLAELDLQIPVQVVPSLTDGAVSTFDEAADLKAYAEQQGWRHLVIVTDAFHSRRALLAFEQVLTGSGLQLEVAAAPNNIFHEGNWWRSDLGIQAYFTEGLKYPIYLFSRRNSSWVRND